MSRSKNVIKNIKYTLLGQIIDLLLSFIVRTMFVYYLGGEYLGLNGLFVNIISILSLAELGVGSAITYSLYEPLANNDEESLIPLMALFKRFYISIGIIIILLGGALIPFLSFFVKDISITPQIKIIYVIFLLNSSVSYLFSYKRSLIIADQKKYIDSLYHYTGKIILAISQIIILIATKNYILFLVLKLIEIIVENILISIKADKMYPFLKVKLKEKLDPSNFRLVIKNIKAMFSHKVGGVIVNSTDNLLISKFIGILSVGIYSNYILITGSINMVIDILFQSINASIGNLVAIESEYKTKNIFNCIDFIGFWIFTFSSVSLFNLLNPFINIWIGEKYVFSTSIVALIVLKFYITGVRKSILTFKEALGLFWYDRYKPIIESIINLFASIILAIKYGISGIIMGTIISTLLTSTWIEPLVLFKYGFKSNLLKYFINYIKRLIIVIFLCIVTYVISNIIVNPSITGFIIRIIITLVIPNFVLLILYYKTYEFKFMVNAIKSFVLNK